MIITSVYGPLHGLLVLKVIFTDRGEQTMLIGSTMALLIGTADVRPNNSAQATAAKRVDVDRVDRLVANPTAL